MTGKQQGVLWLGIVLVIVRMYATGQWTLLWQIVSNPGAGALLTPSNGSGSSPGPSPGNKNSRSL